MRFIFKVKFCTTSKSVVVVVVVAAAVVVVFGAVVLKIFVVEVDVVE